MPTIVLPRLNRRGCMEDGGVVVVRLSMLSFSPQDQLSPVIHDILVCERSHHDMVVKDIDCSFVKFCDQWGLAVVIFVILLSASLILLPRVHRATPPTNNTLVCRHAASHLTAPDP